MKKLIRTIAVFGLASLYMFIMAHIMMTMMVLSVFVESGWLRLVIIICSVLFALYVGNMLMHLTVKTKLGRHIFGGPEDIYFGESIYGS